MVKDNKKIRMKINKFKINKKKIMITQQKYSLLEIQKLENLVLFKDLLKRVFQINIQKQLGLILKAKL